MRPVRGLEGGSRLYATTLDAYSDHGTPRGLSEGGSRRPREASASSVFFGPRRRLELSRLWVPRVIKLLDSACGLWVALA